MASSPLFRDDLINGLCFLLATSDQNFSLEYIEIVMEIITKMKFFGCDEGARIIARIAADAFSGCKDEEGRKDFASKINMVDLSERPPAMKYKLSRKTVVGRGERFDFRYSFLKRFLKGDDGMYITGNSKLVYILLGANVLLTNQFSYLYRYPQDHVHPAWDKLRFVENASVVIGLDSQIS